ncbi:MAG: sensor histidine kinase [Pseudonocardiaceae bacterium]
MNRVRRAWAARPLPLRVAAVVTVVGLVLFLLLAKASTTVVQRTLSDALDGELAAAVATAAPSVAAGRPAPQPAGGDVEVRVLDRAGSPVDGAGPTPLAGQDVRRLLAGLPAWTYPLAGQGHGEGPKRWLGWVVSVPDGGQRLVVAGTESIAHAVLIGRTAAVLSMAAVLAAVAMGAAGWVAARFALQPVARLRVAAAALPAGDRLPLPAARDELRVLTEALNDLLARRDAAAARLRRFTGDAAHELRSPVAAIRAQAEVAVTHPDPELAAETLADIATEAQRLSTLLDDLLALARADAGERLPAQPIDLAAAARDAVGRTRPGRVAVRVTAPAPAVVHAAPSDVARVLDNLLANAVRHARHTVRVAVLPGTGMLRVLVDDDGEGIPPEHRQRVFDRFHRVQDDRDRDTGGTGLGLALVAETVRRYGGTARAGEAPDGGARFELHWPIDRSPTTANRT